MDIIYHAVVGAVVSKAFTGTYSPIISLYAVLPDLIGTFPYYYFKIIKSPKKTFRGFIQFFFKSIQSNKFDQKIDMIMYRSLHSAFAVLCFALIMYMVSSHLWYVYTIGYFSHILIDILTHEGDFATRFFFPISNYHINAINWPKNVRVYIGFWILLILYFFI
jgi:membrane-bound metal-dependent hydrolase YbcI (DUF457 family)